MQHVVLPWTSPRWQEMTGLSQPPWADGADPAEFSLSEDDVAHLKALYVTIGSRRGGCLGEACRFKDEDTRAGGALFVSLIQESWPHWGIHRETVRCMSEFGLDLPHLLVGGGSDVSLRLQRPS